MKKLAIPLALILAGLIGGYLIFHRMIDRSIEPYERQKIIDSIRIARLNDSLAFYKTNLSQKEKEFDTIETIRIVYRDRFDTTKAQQVVIDTSVDSTCRQLLSDCLDLTRQNEIAIKKLKSIIIDHEIINDILEEKVTTLEGQVATRDEYIDQLISDHNKELRKTKILAGVTVVGVIVLAVLLQ